MGLFNRQSATDKKKLEESIAGFKQMVQNNFSEIEINGKKYSSKQIADIAENLFYVGVEEDDEALRSFALYVTREIKPSTNQLMSATERGGFIFNVTSGSMTLREKYSKHRDKSINENIVILGMALMQILESADDWDEVLDASVEYAKKIEELRNNAT